MIDIPILKRLSLKGKLILISMLTCMLGLLLAGAFFGIYERYRVRRSMIQDLSVLSRVLGDRSTAALLFDDPKSAEENLRALRVKPTIVAACIYNDTRAVFASYRAGNADFSESFPAAEETQLHRFGRDSLELFEPIMMGEQRIGTLYIRANLEEFVDLWRQYLLASLAIIVCSGIAAFYLAERLQRVVSTPLDQITQAARRVTQQKDYTVRVQRTSDDEIAVLVQAFNEMLETIGLQNQELTEINKSLECRVAERTEELAKARDRAEAADRLKSAFLATMSHELRTPLNSIIGFNGILLQGLSGPINPEQAKQMRMVRNSATHLLSLISDILDISKIEAGQLKVELKPFDLRESILKTIQTIRPLAEGKSLTVDVHLSAQVGPVVSDQRRVEQILLNLLSNAVKFTDAGSVSIACDVEGSEYVTRITDTGMGIAPDKIDELFRPFHQIDTGLSRTHEGTGLGLSICKRLLELLHGSIKVESTLGQGSCFSFRLPRPDLPAPAP
jgi:signal transduction histidine kinase